MDTPKWMVYKGKSHLEMEAIGGVNSFTGNDPRYDSSMIFLVIDTGNDQLLMMSY